MKLPDKDSCGSFILIIKKNLHSHGLNSVSLGVRDLTRWGSKCPHKNNPSAFFTLLRGFTQ